MYQPYNLKLTNRYREDGGKTCVDPSNEQEIARVVAYLQEVREVEPDHDWHYETQGTEVTWHRVREGPLA